MIKKSKAEVNYSLGKMETRCGNCQHFLGNGECTKVRGYIRREYWCKLWEAKHHDGRREKKIGG